MIQILKYLKLVTILGLLSFNGNNCLFAAEQPDSEAIKTVWTSPELDGEVLELFFGPDTNVCYPDKVLIQNMKTYEYYLLYMSSLGTIDKKISLGRGGYVTWTSDGGKFCVTESHAGKLEGEAIFDFVVYDSQGNVLLKKKDVGNFNTMSPDGKIIVSISGRKGIVEIYNKNGSLTKTIGKPVPLYEASYYRGDVRFAGENIYTLVSDARMKYTFYAMKRYGKLLYTIKDVNKDDIRASFIASNNGDFVIIHSGYPEGCIKKYDMSGKMLWKAVIGTKNQELTISNNDKYLFAYTDGICFLVNTDNGIFVIIKDAERIEDAYLFVRTPKVFNNGTVMFTSRKNKVTIIDKNGKINIEDAPGISRAAKYFDAKNNAFISINTTENISKIVVNRLSNVYMDRIKAKGGITNER